MLLQVPPVGDHRSAELTLDLFVLLPDGTDSLMLYQGIPSGKTLPAVPTVVADFIVVEASLLGVFLSVGVPDALATVCTELPFHNARWGFLLKFENLPTCVVLHWSLRLH